MENDRDPIPKLHPEMSPHPVRKGDRERESEREIEKKDTYKCKRERKGEFEEKK